MAACVANFLVLLLEARAGADGPLQVLANALRKVLTNTAFRVRLLKDEVALPADSETGSDPQLAQQVLLLEAAGLGISSSLHLLEVWRLRSVQPQMRCLLDLKLATLGRPPQLPNLDRESVTFDKIVHIFQAMLLDPQRLVSPDCAQRLPLMRAAQLGSKRLCGALLAAKAEVNAPGGNGWTALHYAATGRCVDTCRTLLDHRAEVEARSLDGYTPFYYAYRAGDHLEIMQLLHARGARPDLRSQNAAGSADWGYLRYAA